VDVADEAAPEQPAPPREPTSLLVGETVRSGRSIVFPGGDVTIVGSVASGAEVIAGGSIHVYGALRGRAVAGLLGQPARIFCRRFEAELLAIDGRYKTIDGADAALRGRAVQAWLDGDSMIVAALD
jgi:septum site-determining protein MinC